MPAQAEPGRAHGVDRPTLAGVLMPDQLRSTSPGLLQAERGTRIPLGSDLDLSLVALDENFDGRLDVIADARTDPTRIWRYLAPTVYRYRGPG